MEGKIGKYENKLSCQRSKIIEDEAAMLKRKFGSEICNFHSWPPAFNSFSLRHRWLIRFISVDDNLSTLTYHSLITRIYCVIFRLQKRLPATKTRQRNGGLSWTFVMISGPARQMLKSVWGSLWNAWITPTRTLLCKRSLWVLFIIMYQFRADLLTVFLASRRMCQ